MEKMALRNEIRALRNIGCHGRVYFDGTPGEIIPFVDCRVPGELYIDLYSREREINGIGNTSDDWDVDECYMRLMIIPFEQNLQGFRRAYRLARMCARLPRYQPRLAFALR
ncbi:hypothetical protein EGX65_03600 [Escherichia coli]|uniref:Uncharacterized protein n=1 Tax=Escherichia coli TaxID=562 RepID=A0A168T6Q9_ECOLX|nr:hypothetical protein [Escherichia coli]EEW5971678.1 hypothetical protein [Escherichia coli]EFA9199955.1 hypothetical protein [Escherichia coli]EFB9698138.1 hypothetical protein [Escherichia coli]EFB9702393.1 hypothetical protein [Escherichia coli]EFC2247451.1 hypothetical protein [Escherichia coli]